jgi:hypothetical protein
MPERVVEPIETMSRKVAAKRSVVAVLTDPEDAKLLVLARAHRARAGSRSGAAVRDTDGRTYSAADVDLPSLRLSAVQLAVAVAATSGVASLEAVVVVGAEDVTAADLAVVRDFAGHGVPIFVTGTNGDLATSLTT